MAVMKTSVKIRSANLGCSNVVTDDAFTPLGSVVCFELKDSNENS